MKKLLASLVLLALLLCPFPDVRAENAVGPTNIIYCNKIATLAVGPATITQIAAGVAGQNISVCGWSVTNTGATGTFSLSYGTGSNCGTGTNTFIPALNITSTAPATDRQASAFFTLPVANALCITPSVATISAVVYYAQF